ncbi:MAG: hypothetical protein ABIB47_03450 [Candidatus Woesearchaeota archaeon]
MKLFQSSKSYLEWKDYAKLIRQRELLHFLHRTSEESYQNLLSKEVI